MAATQRTQGWLGKIFNSNTTTETKRHVPSWYGSLQAYIQQPGSAVWSGRNYRKFADEAYRRNVVANRAINMIARGVCSIDMKFTETDEQGIRHTQAHHPIAALLYRPNPLQSRNSFMEALVSYYLLAGDVFIHAVSGSGEPPRELHLLRPDRVSVSAGQRGMPKGYCYKVDDKERNYPVDPITGASRILHIRHFNPLSDWNGMAPIEAAAYSIDQHNQAASWNQSLLQNGARPSGALVMKMSDGNSRLTEEQYWRLKQQVEEQFTGAQNAGRPLLLEGGLEWKEMSMSPRDMDFLNIKHSSARDIALAFGVPPQLLGIPGDNTYSNLAEARLALWEQTIIPIAQLLYNEIERWLNPMFGSHISIIPEYDNIAALSPKREAQWERVKDADFLSDEEKRRMVGL